MNRACLSILEPDAEHISSSDAKPHCRTPARSQRGRGSLRIRSHDGARAPLEALLGLDVDLSRVDPADHTHVLTRHLAEAAADRLDAERDPVRKLAVANAMLRAINEVLPQVTDPVRELHAVRRHAGPGSSHVIRNDRRRR